MSKTKSPGLLNQPWIATCGCLILIFVRSQAQAEDTIRFHNERMQGVSVFFQPEGLGKFLTPPLTLGPRSEKRVPLSDYRGKRNIVVADEANRFTRIGWVDLEEVARSKNPRVLIDSVFVTETVMTHYTVEVLQTETRINQFGQSYSVQKYVPETRLKEAIVTKELIILKTVVDGEWKPIMASESAFDATH